MPKDETFTEREIQIISRTAEITAQKTIEKQSKDYSEIWLDTKEAAAFLNKSLKTLKKIEDKGELVFTKGEGKNAKKEYQLLSLKNYRDKHLDGLGQFRK